VRKGSLLNRKRIILTVLIILWAGTIFWFSSQIGSVSSSTSGRIVQKVINRFFPQMNIISPQGYQYFYTRVSFLVRKTAHYSEYLILAVLLFSWFKAGRCGYILSAFLGWLLSTVYAWTDEFHQTFVSGRSPMLRDTVIDSAGALTGVIVMMILTAAFAYARGKSRRELT
jgi:VanZ family protein